MEKGRVYKSAQETEDGLEEVNKVAFDRVEIWDKELKSSNLTKAIQTHRSIPILSRAKKVIVKSALYQIH